MSSNLRFTNQIASPGSPQGAPVATARNLWNAAGFQAAALAGTAIWLEAGANYRRYFNVANLASDFEARDRTIQGTRIFKKRVDKNARPYIAETGSTTSLPAFGFGTASLDGLTRNGGDNGAIVDQLGGCFSTGGLSQSVLFYVPSGAGTIYGMTFGAGAGSWIFSSFGTHPNECYLYIDPSTGYLTFSTQYTRGVDLAYNVDCRGAWHQVDIITNPTGSATADLAAHTAIMKVDGTTVVTNSSYTTDFDTGTGSKQLQIGALGAAYTSGNGLQGFVKSYLQIPGTVFVNASVSSLLRAHQLSL